MSIAHAFFWQYDSAVDDQCKMYSALAKAAIAMAVTTLTAGWEPLEVGGTPEIVKAAVGKVYTAVSKGWAKSFGKNAPAAAGVVKEVATTTGSALESNIGMANEVTEAITRAPATVKSSFREILKDGMAVTAWQKLCDKREFSGFGGVLLATLPNNVSELRTYTVYGSFREFLL